jgi:hypothetical protein
MKMHNKMLYSKVMKLLINQFHKKCIIVKCMMRKIRIKKKIKNNINTFEKIMLKNQLIYNNNLYNLFS